jgi:hypothetical protein
LGVGGKRGERGSRRETRAELGGRGGGGTGRPRAVRTRAHLELGHHHDAGHHAAAGGISALAAPAHLVLRSATVKLCPDGCLSFFGASSLASPERRR